MICAFLCKVLQAAVFLSLYTSEAISVSVFVCSVLKITLMAKIKLDPISYHPATFIIPSLTPLAEVKH